MQTNETQRANKMNELDGHQFAHFPLPAGPLPPAHCPLPSAPSTPIPLQLFELRIIIAFAI